MGSNWTEFLKDFDSGQQQEKSEVQKCESHLYDVAIGYLSRREYSRYELSNRLEAAHSKLVEKDDNLVPMSDELLKSTVARVLDGLESDNYLSDIRFAQMVLKARLNKCYGLFRIKMELREKGVSEDDIRTVLNYEDIDWNSVSQEAYKKRFNNNYGHSDGYDLDLKERSKRMRYLQNRGFDQDQIKYAIGRG